MDREGTKRKRKIRMGREWIENQEERQIDREREWGAT